MRVSQQLLSAVEKDLKAAKLPRLSWYDVLLELRRAGPDGLRPFELQDKLLLAQYNQSRLIDRLAKAGLVSRDAYESDGRGQVLRITAQGQDTLAVMWEVYRQSIFLHFTNKLSEEDIADLGQLLKSLKPRSGNNS